MGTYSFGQWKKDLWDGDLDAILDRCQDGIPSADAPVCPIFVKVIYNRDNGIKNSLEDVEHYASCPNCRRGRDEVQYGNALFELKFVQALQAYKKGRLDGKH